MFRPKPYTTKFLKLLSVFIICIALTGCGKSSEIETQAGINAKEPLEEAMPVYSAEDDKEVAEYLSAQYGIVFSESPAKVILDCDMTYLGDDSMCMCILAQADSLGLIDLLGVTITGGNSFVASGTNATLTQLEMIGRADIPVYMGTDIPINGFRNMDAQEKIVGKIDHYGVMYNLDSYIEPDQYHNLGSAYERKWGYSQKEPAQQNSVDFMIEQVDKYPGEVNIISVGAATNIAMACQKEESFASNTAGIIYMGTIVTGEGSYTPYADFNCFYDAEAFSICLKSDFPSQTIVPHDAAKSAVLNKAVFDLIDSKNDTLISKMWLDNQYSLYQRTPSHKTNCTDAIAAVVFLNNDVVLEKKNLYLTINTDEADAKYGSTVIWDSKDGASDAVEAAFILDVDTNLYWNFVTDIICHAQHNSAYTYSYFMEINDL